ncbi:MAG TPA: ATP-binding cassette domain-containing protein [Nitrospiria bacterium]|nr:ATP-binding cassette domain-containing protein [Nitrospiria bacterium]
MSGPSIITAANLVKRFGKTTAVDGLSLEMYEGEVFGLLGPNGAGKTTTMRMLITLLQPDGGDITVGGYKVRENAERVRSLIGYIPQERAIDRALTGREHLALFADLYHLPKAEGLERAEWALKLVGLEDRADEVVMNYSGGMKKRLEIACGLIHRPKILFLDEPTLGLDVESRTLIWRHIRELKAQGMTMVMSTNYLDEADQLCDRLAIIAQGKLAALGTPRQLKESLQGDVLLLTPEGADTAALERLAISLKGLEGVVNVVRRDGSLELRVTPSRAILNRVLDAVASQGARLEAIQYTRPSLEKVFIHYTGRHIKDVWE